MSGGRDGIVFRWRSEVACLAVSVSDRQHNVDHGIAFDAIDHSGQLVLVLPIQEVFNRGRDPCSQAVYVGGRTLKP